MRTAICLVAEPSAPGGGRENRKFIPAPSPETCSETISGDEAGAGGEVGWPVFGYLLLEKNNRRPRGTLCRSSRVDLRKRTLHPRCTALHGPCCARGMRPVGRHRSAGAHVSVRAPRGGHVGVVSGGFMRVSARDVLAQWTYSELLSGRYPEVPERLVDKARRGVPFGEIDENERELLAKAFPKRTGGAGVFLRALRGIKEFRLTEWSRDQLGASFVLPYFVQEVNVNPLSLVTFRDWLEGTSRCEITDQNHARYAGDKPGDPHPHKPPATASWASNIIQSAAADALMLVDGYHRAVWFWKKGGPDGRFALYVPIRTTT